MIYATCDKCGNDAGGVPEILAILEKKHLIGKKINFEFPQDKKPLVHHRINLCKDCYTPYTKALVEYVYKDKKK